MDEGTAAHGGLRADGLLEHLVAAALLVGAHTALLLEVASLSVVVASGLSQLVEEC